MKTCTNCGDEKPLDDFYPLKSGVGRRATAGTFGECKQCNRERAKEWQRARRAADPEYSRRVAMRTLYGIGPEDYERLLAAQSGGCAICGTQRPGGRGQRFHVDHHHDTGKVRGLLCHGCNTAVGALGEDVDRLMAAAAYLLASKNVLEAVVF